MVIGAIGVVASDRQRIGRTGIERIREILSVAHFVVKQGGKLPITRKDDKTHPKYLLTLVLPVSMMMWINFVENGYGQEKSTVTKS